MPEIKAGEVIVVILIIFAILGSSFGSGWYFRGIRAEKDMLAYQAEQQEAVDQDREEKQAKSDQADDEAYKEIEELMIKNANLQEKLDAETSKTDYDCIVPDDGVMLHNNALRTE